MTGVHRPLRACPKEERRAESTWDAAPEKRQERPRLYVWRTAVQPRTTVVTWRNVVCGDAANMTRSPRPSAVPSAVPSRRVGCVRSLTLTPFPCSNSETSARPGLGRPFPNAAQRYPRAPATQAPLVRSRRSRQRSSATFPTEPKFLDGASGTCASALPMGIGNTKTASRASVQLLAWKRQTCGFPSAGFNRRGQRHVRCDP